MMKAPLLIAAALIGTAGIAQTQTTTPDASATTSTTTTDAAAAATPAPTDTAPVATSSAGSPASVPPGTTDMSASGTAMASADTSNYPPCSRTVTDKCVQRGAAHKAHRRG